MVRSKKNEKDIFQIYTELNAQAQAALARQPNRMYVERHSNVINRGIVTERGMSLRGLDSTTIPTIVNHRNWQRYIQTPEKYHPALVHEFYASMVPEVFKHRGFVWVQNTQVVITPEGINEYLLTQAVPELEPVDGMPIDYMFDNAFGDVVAAIRRAPLDVQLSGDLELNHAELRPDLAFWSVFITHNLRPSSHRTIVKTEITRLLYALQNNIEFDVGHIIFSQIIETGCSKRCRLSFPCLITHFCRRAGIAEASNEVTLVAPMSDLGTMAYNSYCTRQNLPNLPTEGQYRRRGRLAAARQQAETAAEEELEDEHIGDVDPPPSSSGGPAENPPPWAADLRDELTNISRRVDQVYQILRDPHAGTTYVRGHRRVVYDPSTHQSEDDA